MRARRSSRVSRSARSFWTSEPWSDAVGSAAVPGCSSLPSEGGSSCSTSMPCSSYCVFPLLLAINCSLILVQNFVKQPRDVGHGRNGVLIIHSRGTKNRQRSHNLAAHSGGSANQHQVAKRRLGFVQSDHNAHRFLACIQVGAQQLNQFLFLFQGLQQILEPRTVLLIGNKVGGAFDKHNL